MTQGQAERWARWAKRQPGIDYAWAGDNARNLGGVEFGNKGFTAIAFNPAALTRLVAALAPREKTP